MKPITNLRKAVATLANCINKKIKDLSAAFTKAWQMVKGKILISKIAGVTFRNRQAALARLARINPKNIIVELVREADNKCDVNAVAVHVAVNGSGLYHLGYLPRETAGLVAKLLENEVEIAASFQGVTGGTFDKFNYGALVAIAL